MPVIRACSHCETKNRIPAKHLSDTARCGACKESLPPLAKPLAADVALFDEIVQNLLSQSWSTSGLAGAARVAWPLLRWQRQPWRQLVMRSSSRWTLRNIRNLPRVITFVESQISLCFPEASWSGKKQGLSTTAL